MSPTRHRIALAPVCHIALLRAQCAVALTRPHPEIATDVAANQRSVHAEKFMAATANPYATQAAYDIP